MMKNVISIIAEHVWNPWVCTCVPKLKKKNKINDDWSWRMKMYDNGPRGKQASVRASVGLLLPESEARMIMWE